MKKLTILSATLLSSALILSACSSTSEKKKKQINKLRHLLLAKTKLSKLTTSQLWIKMEKQ